MSSCLQESFDIIITAFCLEGRYRIALIVLGDGMLGLIMEPIIIPFGSNRSRQQPIDKPWEHTGCKERWQSIIKSFYMRAGPGLGNIWPAQSDYFQATRGGGNGEYRCIVLAPSSVQESFDIMKTAFCLADRYRNPVIVLGDGMLGQMMEPIIIPLGSNRSRQKPIDKPWALTGCKERRQNIIKSFYMRAGDLEKFNLKLQKKYAQIVKDEERYEEVSVSDAKIILVAYGTMARIAKSALKSLRKMGIRAGLIRPITLWPFPIKAFNRVNTRVKSKKRYLVLEMSYGQMVEDVRLALKGRAEVDFLGRAGGGVLSEEEIIKRVVKLYG